MAYQNLGDAEDHAEEDAAPMTPKDANAGAKGGSGLLDRALYGGFLVALILLVLVSGAVLTVAGIFPGPQIARAYYGGRRSTAS